ncbi:MAG: ABC transporter ATP-binding protein [Betaproteobacteria bacterium]|nr:ABC transporter ATP-binding protein [Betaproteobacteria bacterium]
MSAPAATSSAAILRLEDVTMSFGGVAALNELDMQVEQGGIIGLIGPNGAGKTTAFNIISGFYTPQKGRILFDARDITGLPPERVCTAGIARTFQNIRLFHNLSVLDNVMLGSHVRRKGQWWMAPLGLPSFKREERAIAEDALELLERLDIVRYAKERSSSLPYGAQRRLEIARALATRPRLLLLDEPAAGMNPQESADLMHFITRVRSEFGLSILLIEHDMKVVMGVCERIWVLEYGRLIAEGTPEDVRHNPDVLRAYLGKEEE